MSGGVSGSSGNASNNPLSEQHKTEALLTNKGSSKTDTDKAQESERTQAAGKAYRTGTVAKSADGEEAAAKYEAPPGGKPVTLRSPGKTPQDPSHIGISLDEDGGHEEGTQSLADASVKYNAKSFSPHTMALLQTSNFSSFAVHGEGSGGSHSEFTEDFVVHSGSGSGGGQHTNLSAGNPTGGSGEEEPMCSTAGLSMLALLEQVAQDSLKEGVEIEKSAAHLQATMTQNEGAMSGVTATTDIASGKAQQNAKNAEAGSDVGSAVVSGAGAAAEGSSLKGEASESKNLDSQSKAKSDEIGQHDSKIDDLDDKIAKAKAKKASGTPGTTPGTPGTTPGTPGTTPGTPGTTPATTPATTPGTPATTPGTPTADGTSSGHDDVQGKSVEDLQKERGKHVKARDKAVREHGDITAKKNRLSSHRQAHSGRRQMTIQASSSLIAASGKTGSGAAGLQGAAAQSVGGVTRAAKEQESSNKQGAQAIMTAGQQLAEFGVQNMAAAAQYMKSTTNWNSA